MATRTTRVASQAAFIVDHQSIDRIDGRQIDWNEVGAGVVDADTGKKRIPGGWKMYEVSPGGKIAPTDGATGQPAAAEEVIGILATDAGEGDQSAALSGYGVIVGGVLYLQLLPQAAVGATLLDNVGKGFVLVPYADDSAS